MKNLFKIIAFIGIALSIYACNKDDNNVNNNAEERCPPRISESVIYGYLLYDTLYFFCAYGEEAHNYMTYNDDAAYIQINELNGHGEVIEWSNTLETLDIDGNLEHDTRKDSIYNHFKCMYGDSIYKGSSCDWIQRTITDTIDFINVTCNSQWDKNHPEGSLLNDIMTVTCTTGEALVDVTRIKDKPLVDFNNEDHYMVELYVVLRFTSPPEKSEPYTFNVTYTTTAGKEISYEAVGFLNIMGDEN